MTKKQKPKTTPFSLRLTFQERQVLEEAANGVPLGRFIRSRLFNPEAEPIVYEIDEDSLSPQMIAQMLGGLGDSGLAESLADLSQAAKIGSLPLDQELQDNLAQASQDVEEMRLFLMHALGLRSD